MFLELYMFLELQLMTSSESQCLDAPPVFPLTTFYLHVIPLIKFME